MFSRKRRETRATQDRIKDIHAMLRGLDKRTRDLESATFPIYAKERAIQELRFMPKAEDALAFYRGKSPRDV